MASTTHIKNLNKYLKRYDRVVLQKAYTTLKDVAKEAVVAVKEAVVAAPPTKTYSRFPMKDNGAVATGKYRDAWRAKRLKQGGSMGVLVYNTLVHAPRVEFGRKAGNRMPPVAAIRKWIQTKFSIPYRRARKLAWPVARAIARDGYRGRPVLFKTSTADRFSTSMENAISKAQLAAAKQVFG